MMKLKASFWFKCIINDITDNIYEYSREQLQEIRCQSLNEPQWKKSSPQAQDAVFKAQQDPQSNGKWWPKSKSVGEKNSKVRARTARESTT